MKKKLNLMSLLFVVIHLTSCNNNSITSNDILGTWKAIAIYNKERPIEIDYPIIKFVILENGTYDYFGTLGYKESGRWHIQKEFLITRDTLLSGAQEKFISISNLTQESLEMKIKEEQKELVLVMEKI